jgi:hypothetical protein
MAGQVFELLTTPGPILLHMSFLTIASALKQTAHPSATYVNIRLQSAIVVNNTNHTDNDNNKRQLRFIIETSTLTYGAMGTQLLQIVSTRRDHNFN